MMCLAEKHGLADYTKKQRRLPVREKSGKAAAAFVIYAASVTKERLS